MKSELVHAFENARYRVLDPEIEIKINQTNRLLDSLLKKYRARSWAFITPFNPESRVVSPWENESQLGLLRMDVENYISFDGTGGGQEEGSPLENSLLILKISRAKSERLGRKYGQDAIVFGLRGRPAEILVLNPNIA